MVFSFFDINGVIYTRYAPVGTKINSMYVIDVLTAFLKVFRRKRQDLSTKNWFLHWDNAPVHTASNVKEFIGKKNINMLAHAPYSPDLAPADFFLFPKAKQLLEGTRINGNSVRTEWERVLSMISTDDFAMAFNKWSDRHAKCISIGGDYVEKS